MSQLKVGDREFKILDNVPEEYTALEQAISRLFYVCGSKTLCGACFQGKLLDYQYRYDVTQPDYAVHKDIIQDKKKPSDTYWKSRGCCGMCSNLSSQGCVQKPLGCAAWQCGYTSMLLPERISDFLTHKSSNKAEQSWNRPGQIRSAYNGILHRWLAKKLSPVIETGWEPYPRSMFSYFRIEGLRSAPLIPNDLRLLSIAAKRINRIADWLERTGLNKTNWPLMEKITRAEEGVLC